MRYTQNAPIKEVRDLFEKEARFKGVQVSEFGSKEKILIKFPFVETAENERSERYRGQHSKTQRRF